MVTAAPLTTMHSQDQPTGIPSIPGAPDAGNHSVAQDLFERKRLALLNVQRQKRMASDTEKLLVLAREVKADSDRSDKNLYSTAELRKVEQIEKLAHSVNEKMRNLVGN